MQLYLDFDSTPTKKDIDCIQHGLDHYNKIKLKQRPKDFAIYLRNSKNEIHGGIYALFYTDSVHVILLWIDAKARSQSYGTQLLREVEEEGIRRNCQFVFVDTFEFQGSSFYLKKGYECVGRINNVLLGHTKTFFKKSLLKKTSPITNHYQVDLVAPTLAEKICRDIISDLPEYFGIPEANERYAKGTLKRLSFAVSHQGDYQGLLTLEFPFQNNANLYWMGIKKSFQGKGIGSFLIEQVEKYCTEQGCFSLTVETLSPKEKDEHYSKTYKFYEKVGFKPLFELRTYGPDFLMVYMQKTLLED